MGSFVLRREHFVPFVRGCVLVTYDPHSSAADSVTQLLQIFIGVFS